jgi:ABC-type oligopeptide transport system substrate-binding subunit
VLKELDSARTAVRNFDPVASRSPVGRHHRSLTRKYVSMRRTAFVGGALIALALTLTACGAPSGTAADSSSAPKSSSSAQAMSESTSSRTGAFEGLNDKKVQGSVTVDGSEIVLSGFSSDEGPDLHVYLTNGTDEAAVSAGKQIDAVSYDTASQTFTLDGVDAASFNTVVIHCDKAKAVFGAAALK